MNSKVVGLIAFAFGGAVGSVVTWQVLKSRYDQLMQEETQALKEMYAKKASDNTESANDISEDEARIEAVESKVSYPEFPEGMFDDYVANVGAYQKREEYESTPYVIPPEEYGEKDNFSQISFTLYADGILADEDDRPVEDIENTVGKESLSHVGEYEQDAVHIRNERLGCDYEVLVDQRTYEEVLGIKPYLKALIEDEDDE